MNTKKTIVIIGASRGIGAELVTHFAHNPNHEVYAFSRNVDRMKRSFSQENVFPGFLDVQADDVHEKLDNLLHSVSVIDYVIFTSGKLINKPFLELTRDDISSCYETNSIGVMFATQYFIPKMLEKGGHIVNISTMGAFQGSVKFPGLAAYSSSKAGLGTFTELFAEEYKETKIRMNCLCLGAVQTEMLAAAFPGLKAPVTPEEMAVFIADFTVNASQFYNGKVLPVSATTP